MRVHSLPIAIENLIVSPEQLAPRTPGRHVSGVINYLSRSLGRRDNHFTLIDLEHFALLGRVFEVVLSQTMFKPPRYERLGEIERDGIIGSPDAFDCVDGKVVEMKCTWTSSSTDIIEKREYFWQLMSYCYMTECTEAILAVLYICGDWKPPVPCLRQYNITFTQAELRQNWEMILRNSDDAASLG